MNRNLRRSRSQRVSLRRLTTAAGCATISVTAAALSLMLLLGTRGLGVHWLLPVTATLLTHLLASAAGISISTTAAIALHHTLTNNSPTDRDGAATAHAEQRQQRRPTPPAKEPATAATLIITGLRTHTAPTASKDVPQPEPRRSAAQQPLELLLLGPLELRTNEGTPLHLHGALRQLLVYLALHPHGAARAALHETLWPNLEPQRRQQRLWQATSDCRRTLGPLITRRGNRYQLNPDRITLDLDRFEQHRHAADNTDAETRQRHLEAAVQLIRGEPLADCDYGWIATHKRHLEAQAAQAILELAQHQLEQRNPSTAIALAEQGLRLDQLDEQFWRIALQAEAQLGLRQALTRRYTHLQQLLDTQLGIRPETETRQLYLNLLGQT